MVVVGSGDVRWLFVVLKAGERSLSLNMTATFILKTKSKYYHGSIETDCEESEGTSPLNIAEI